MTVTELKNISKSFGSVRVIEPMDLKIKRGDLMVVVGPSGCGKSTLLRMIAGLEQASSGSIHIDGVDVTSKEPSERGVTMVFQNYALYPHMSVRQNMAFGLEMGRMPKREREAVIRKAAATLQLEEFLDRKPRQLSGGQRQRVAIGRAIVRSPKLFLFDEPLSNLDAELRAQMRLEITRLHRELGSTMIYVTHDQVEAMTLATQIVVLRDGRIEQTGTPGELYTDPDTIFVAGFIGSPRMNLLPASVTGVDERGRAIIDVLPANMTGIAVNLREVRTDLPQDVVLGVRPEDLILSEDHDVEREGKDLWLTCEIIEDLGSSVFLYNSLNREDAIVAALPRGRKPGHGSIVPYRIAPDGAYLFDRDGRRL
ncbi:MAG: sn-glycerol-3-phosphate ABC transporter ATP-binding protein UgpC [Rhodobacteraceae bacterium]|nr:sn-glycerol-3-phosphate ABC transporter ATP-binding protein UgpC [Paracoccaceae bacterium]